jgi:hypothetical protein
LSENLLFIHYSGLEKEQRNLEYLQAEQATLDAELVDSVIDYLSIGTAVTLSDGSGGIFLGCEARKEGEEEEAGKRMYFVADT